METQKIIHDLGTGIFLGLGVAAALLGIVFVIRWLLLPFAVFGIRDRLDRVLVQLAELQRQLVKMADVPGPSGTESNHAPHDAVKPAMSRDKTKCPHCDQPFETKDLPLGTPQQCSHCHKPIYTF